MTAEFWLRTAYAANMLILIPVVGTLVSTGHPGGVFGANVQDSPALRWLVASLWGGILLCSLAGLFAPRLFIGILVLQVFYKVAWLIAYVLPTLRHEGWTSVPLGPTLTFIPIVVLWPFIIARALAN